VDVSGGETGVGSDFGSSFRQRQRLGSVVQYSSYLSRASSFSAAASASFPSVLRRAASATRTSRVSKYRSGFSFPRRSSSEHFLGRVDTASLHGPESSSPACLVDNDKSGQRLLRDDCLRSCLVLRRRLMDQVLSTGEELGKQQSNYTLDLAPACYHQPL
jgi:hypothetical protein